MTPVTSGGPRSAGGPGPRVGRRRPPRRRAGRSPSAVRSARSARLEPANGSSSRSARPAPRGPARIRQCPACSPSTRKVPSWAPLPGKSGICRPSGLTRRRSACESSRLSYSGRYRTGAGVSGSGRGARGQVVQLGAVLAAERPEPRGRAGRRPRAAGSARTRPGCPARSSARGRRGSAAPGRRPSGSARVEVAARARTASSAASPDRPRPRRRAASAGPSAAGRAPCRRERTGRRPETGAASAWPSSVRPTARSSISSRAAARTAAGSRRTDLLGPLAAAPTALGHPLEDRPPGERVPGGDQVDGDPHQRRPDDPTAADQVGQLLGLEAGQPGPEPDVRRQWRLRLHPGQPLDRRDRGEVERSSSS